MIAFTSFSLSPVSFRSRFHRPCLFSCSASPAAASGDAVTVYVRATLADGTLVTDRPVSFTLGRHQTQPDFEAAVFGLRVGDTRNVRIRAAPLQRALIHTNPSLDGVLTNGLLARSGDANHLHAGRIHDVSLELLALNNRSLPCDVDWAVFAGGSFWSLSLAMRRVRDVLYVATGYAGGHLRNATYLEVASGRSGHAEAVAVHGSDYSTLLNTFWSHLGDAACTLNQCGNDVGTQYRSAIFCTTDAQLEAAERSIAGINASLGRRVVTEVLRYDPSKFVIAERIHQHYLEKRGQSAGVGDTTPIVRYG